MSCQATNMMITTKVLYYLQETLSAKEIYIDIRYLIVIN